MIFSSCRNYKPCQFVVTSELNFHIWNANRPMKCEFKMAAYRGQFCTSLSVPYAGLYFSLSLPRDFLHFPEGVLFENMLPRALQVLCCQCKNTKTIYNSLLQTFIIVFHSLCQTFLVSDFALLVTLVATILIKSYLMRRHTPHTHDVLKLHLTTIVHPVHTTN